MRRDDAASIALPVRVASYTCDKCLLEAPGVPVAVAPGRFEDHPETFLVIEDRRPAGWGDVHIPHMNRRADLCGECLEAYEAAVETAVLRR